MATVVAACSSRAGDHRHALQMVIDYRGPRKSRTGSAGRLFHGDRYKVSLQLTAINVTNKTALYNFPSTFSGTHYVTPRTLTAQIGFHF
jgi:hypothetical protein